MLVFEDAIVISLRPVSVSFAMQLRSRPGQLHHRPARPWRDTGSGIPPRVLERMFDPFFTTNVWATARALASRWCTASSLTSAGGLTWRRG